MDADDLPDYLPTFLENFCAIEVPSFDGLTPDIGRMRVPAATPGCRRR